MGKITDADFYGLLGKTDPRATITCMADRKRYAYHRIVYDEHIGRAVIYTGDANPIAPLTLSMTFQQRAEMGTRPLYAFIEGEIRPVVEIKPIAGADGYYKAIVLVVGDYHYEATHTHSKQQVSHRR